VEKITKRLSRKKKPGATRWGCWGGSQWRIEQNVGGKSVSYLFLWEGQGKKGEKVTLGGEMVEKEQGKLKSFPMASTRLNRPYKLESRGELQAHNQGKL